tara:strand:+ start:3834 stop:4001 length:168 start_codon:yes stop_codon:yes gene_type:complete
MKIRIEYKLSEDRPLYKWELSLIESTIAACHPGFIVHESWGEGDAIIYELREKKQ